MAPATPRLDVDPEPHGAVAAWRHWLLPRPNWPQKQSLAAPESLTAGSGVPAARAHRTV